MMARRLKRVVEIGLALAMAGAWAPAPGWAQTSSRPAERQAANAQLPDAQQIREELNGILEAYPPAVRRVLQWDPNLMGNQAYLAPYPALAAFVNAHPELARNPSFYVGDPPNRGMSDTARAWDNILGFSAALVVASLVLGALMWAIRTLIEYKRWSRLTRVQTEVHTKLMDRFGANEDLLAYLKSPAGSKFLESSPITLEAAPRSFGAPMARIFGSVQAGLVLVAGGIGLRIVGAEASNPVVEPLRGFGVVAIAIGVGFVISAIISFLLSRQLGLIEPPAEASRNQLPSA